MLTCIILAAGQGKRMRSSLAKVLHPILDRPMLAYVVEAARSLEPAKIVVVVGHGGDEVRRAFAAARDLAFVEQKEQLGTGHAVKVALDALGTLEGDVVVLSGDVPALEPEALRALVEARRTAGASAAVLAAEIADPTGYGRVLADGDGKVRAIREHKDCSPEERSVRRINSGIYAFDGAALSGVLPRIGRRNAQGEYYLTDAVELLVAEKKRVVATDAPDVAAVLGVNDRLALADMERILQRRINRGWQERGVTMIQPETIRIDPTTVLAEDVVVEPNTVLFGSTVHRGAVLEAGVRLVGCTVGEGTRLRQGTYAERAVIGKAVTVGPFAHLRPGTVLGDDVKIGNFVETKQATFGPGAKASHLAYIGDAEIGARVNLGCGFITCNFDGGPVKHRTIVEDDAFVGSDSQTVAPVRVGKGAYVASGTTVTRDVPPGALAIARTKQDNKEGYGEKLRARAARKKTK